MALHRQGSSSMALHRQGSSSLASGLALHRQPRKRKTTATTQMPGLPLSLSTRECSLCWTPASLRAKGCKLRLTILWPRPPAHYHSLSMPLAPSTLIGFVRVSKVATLTFSRLCRHRMYWQAWVVLGSVSSSPASVTFTDRTSTTTPHRQCRPQMKLRANVLKMLCTAARLPALTRGSHKARTS